MPDLWLDEHVGDEMRARPEFRSTLRRSLADEFGRSRRPWRCHIRRRVVKDSGGRGAPRRGARQDGGGARGEGDGEGRDRARARRGA